MNLQQLYSLADRRSYYSRSPDDIYAALNAAAKKIYLWTVREFRGTFRKTDTTTVQLAPNVQTYALPPDCRIIIKFGEQVVGSPAGQPYQWMRPADVNSQTFEGREYESSGFGNSFGWGSRFVYAGPYLADADALALQGPPGNPGDQIRSVDISPIPQDQRQTKLVYAAQFIEIAGPGSPLMLPSESHDAILDFAVAELVRPNSDMMLAGGYEDAGGKKMQEDFLPYWRMNQQDDMPIKQEPYLDSLD